jgi:hypothetical protein
MTMVQNVQRWVGEQMFMMMSEAVGQPSVVSDDFFKVLTNKCVKDDTSQFQNFHVNFHKYHTFFSMRLSQ